MSDAIATLVDQVHGLMRQTAAGLDDIDQLKRGHEREIESFVKDVLEVLDSLERTVTRVTDPEAREAVAAIAYQVQLLLEGRGYTTIEFQRGALAPLVEIQVVSTVTDASLPDLAVVRMMHRGLRKGTVIVRRAGVEINKR